MLLSMTGFGDARSQSERLSVYAELRAVNNRYLKILTKLSERYQPLEGEIERVVRDAISRGTVNVIVRVEEFGATRTQRLDGEVLERYLQQLRDLAAGLGMAPPGDLAGLLDLPGVITEGDNSIRDPHEDWPLIEAALRSALAKFAEFRAAEGDSMERDLRANMGIVSDALEKVARRAPQIVRDFRDKLHERVKELMGEADVSVSAADLIREVSIFAERSDISEEIIRLRSHLDQLEVFMGQNQSQGRKLDFLTQEMARETNTIGSKANDVDVAHAVVEIKAAIERMREVLQNVE